MMKRLAQHLSMDLLIIIIARASWKLVRDHSTQALRVLRLGLQCRLIRHQDRESMAHPLQSRTKQIMLKSWSIAHGKFNPSKSKLVVTLKKSKNKKCKVLKAKKLKRGKFHRDYMLLNIVQHCPSSSIRYHWKRVQRSRKNMML